VTPSGSFAGRRVFVFGGTSGINLAIAAAFAAAGANVGVASRKPDKVAAAVAKLSSPGNDALGYVADVRDPQAVSTALSEFAARHGAIDVLVSGAAGNFPAAAANLSPNGFKTVVDIDLLGTFNVARGAYPFLCKPGASIINISAPQSVIPMAKQAHVCAAKAGIDMLTRVLAIEWGPEGIRVNAVIPGPIGDTEGMARLTPDEASRNAVIATVPLRRFGDTGDIADVCLFLASRAARYVSGVVLPVDGGWTAAGAPVALPG